MSKLTGTSPEQIMLWLNNSPRTHDGETITSPAMAARVIAETLVDRAPEDPASLWRGKPIGEMNADELRVALCELGKLYNRRTR